MSDYAKRATARMESITPAHNQERQEMVAAHANDSTQARRNPVLHKKGNDYITGAECLLMVRGQIREYERAKRERVLWRRLVRAVKAVFA